jgi:hypothetical protein
MKIWLIVVVLLQLVACSKAETIPLLAEPVPLQTLASTDQGLSLVLEENSFNEAPSVIKTTIRNDGQQDYQFGEFYSIEMKKEGQWYAVVYSDAVFFNNRAFKDYGRVLEPHTEFQQAFSIDELGLALVSGEYRLVKTLLGEDREISIAVLFTVK